MTTSLAVRPQRLRLLREVDGPRRLVAHIPPNWFAAVMGTGIVANAAAGLPLQPPGLRVAATGVWALAAALLVVVAVATGLHWALHPEAARRHHRHPVTSHFYGAPAMALPTVGAGTLLLGRDWIGLPAAVGVDLVLWTAGTALGLATAVTIPLLAFTRQDGAPVGAFGGWLMPIVPPMVSASAGALLLPHVPVGQVRTTLLWACYGMAGLSGVASLVVVTLVWHRLAHHGVGEAATVPTLWIVLGPVGQSITAVNLLADGARVTVGPAVAQVLLVVALVLGFGALGFALLWAAVAGLVTIRAAGKGLPFSLTWWSFTFPVGTCVTGLNGLSAHTGLVAVEALAVVADVGLVFAWLIVAVRTFHGTVVLGSLLLPPAA